MLCSEKMAENLMSRNSGTLDISQTCITQLPERLTVKGDLILNRFIKKLPDKLTVYGNLDLRNTQVDLQDTSQLTVEGNLYTGPHTTGFKWCVDVGGDLDLRASKFLQSIDNGSLIVMGNLYLDDNNIYITSIRQMVGVRGNLILRGSKVEKFSFGRLIYAKNIDLSYSAINQLPDEFVVYGDLNISNTDLANYPEKMVVFGNLDIRNTKLPMPHKNVCVLGKIITDLRRDAIIFNKFQERR